MIYEKSHKRVTLIIIHTKEDVAMQGHFSLTYLGKKCYGRGFHNTEEWTEMWSSL